jgi:hypothetical protein
VSVTSNPEQRGTATLSIDGISDSNNFPGVACPENGIATLGAAFDMAFNTFPLVANISDSTGAPVTIENAAVAQAEGFADDIIDSCSINVNLSGTADNSHNALTFDNQTLTGCPASPLTLNISSIFDQTAGAFVFVSGPEVLTTGSMGGSDVATGDTFSSDASVTGSTISCNSGRATGSVVENDLTPGTGEYLVSGLTLSSCTALGFPATVTVSNLPYPLTATDSSGFPATLFGLFATVSADGLTCIYSGTPNGSVLPTGAISFPNQTFGLNTGSAGCPGLVTASLTLGQPTDTSVLGNPHIYTN